MAFGKLGMAALAGALALAACKTSGSSHENGKIACAQSPLTQTAGSWTEVESCRHDYNQNAALSAHTYTNVYGRPQGVGLVGYTKATGGTILTPKPALERAKWHSYIAENMVHHRPSRTFTAGNGWKLVSLPFKTESLECTFYTHYMTSTAHGYSEVIDGYVCGGDTREAHADIRDSFLDGLRLRKP